MTTLLQLNSSIHNGSGQSSQLAKKFVATFKARHPDTEVIERELAGAGAIPHLTAERFAAFLTKPESRTAAQHADVAYSDALIEELQRADVIVLGLPLYNFGVPSSLKAYFDHVARAGITFKYSDKGPVGLLTGKKVYIFAARGGVYVGTPMDTQTDYVRSFLRFIGLDDVEFVYAEGLAMGPESKAASLAMAAAQIEQLAA